MATTNDRAVLHSIFNPNLPLGNENVPGIDDVDDEEVIEEETEITKESKRLEICGVKSAESGDLNSALDYFSQAIEVAPLRASGYNNRAQGLRLKGDVQGAILDLDKAVELSGGKGKVACQAYTQRALIRRLEGQNELALEDFKSASSLGSEFARSQVIQLNPYAAMCNKMLSEVVTKLRNGEYLDS